MPGIICPVVRYAPTAAKKPNIAAHPLILSAISFSGSTVKLLENGFIKSANRKLKTWRTGLAGM